METNFLTFSRQRTKKFLIWEKNLFWWPTCGQTLNIAGCPSICRKYFIGKNLIIILLLLRSLTCNKNLRDLFRQKQTLLLLETETKFKSDFVVYQSKVDNEGTCANLFFNANKPGKTPKHRVLAFLFGTDIGKASSKRFVNISDHLFK